LFEVKQWQTSLKPKPFCEPTCNYLTWHLTFCCGPDYWIDSMQVELSGVLKTLYELHLPLLSVEILSDEKPI